MLRTIEGGKWVFTDIETGKQFEVYGEIGTIEYAPGGFIEPISPIIFPVEGEAELLITGVQAKKIVKYNMYKLGIWGSNNWRKLRRGGILHRYVQIMKALRMMGWKP